VRGTNTDRPMTTYVATVLSRKYVFGDISVNLGKAERRCPIVIVLLAQWERTTDSVRSRREASRLKLRKRVNAAGQRLARTSVQRYSTKAICLLSKENPFFFGNSLTGILANSGEGRNRQGVGASVRQGPTTPTHQGQPLAKVGGGGNTRRPQSAITGTALGPSNQKFVQMQALLPLRRGKWAFNPPSCSLLPEGEGLGMRAIGLSLDRFFGFALTPGPSPRGRGGRGMLATSAATTLL
jgi:hypothetical protein